LERHMKSNKQHSADVGESSEEPAASAWLYTVLSVASGSDPWQWYSCVGVSYRTQVTHVSRTSDKVHRVQYHTWNLAKIIETGNCYPGHFLFTRISRASVNIEEPAQEKCDNMLCRLWMMSLVLAVNRNVIVLWTVG
jgi:hypothetical protein